jgi:hypothetical protein
MKLVSVASEGLIRSDNIFFIGGPGIYPGKSKGDNFRVKK